MKLSLLPRHRFTIGLAAQIGIFLLLPFCSRAQTFFGASSNPADNGTVVTGTVAVIPPAAMAAGDLVVMYAHHRLASATLSISATGGQSWTRETIVNGSGNQSYSIFWCRYNGAWPANPSVTGGNGAEALSVIMYVYRPTSSSNSWGIHIGAANSSVTGTTVNITGLTTTVTNTVTMAFWASPFASTWGTLTGTGWSKTGLAVQNRNLGGTDQSHTAAYNIRPAAGTVASVAQTQSSSQVTQRSIISWRELAPPANDLCAGAISLTSAGTCNNTAGTLNGSTYSGIPAIGCGIAERNDVWYRFVAQTTTPTIALSAAPANPDLQLFSGTCTGLTSLACGSTSIAATGLTIGTTYYIRVYTDPNYTGNGGSFNICVTDPPPANNACAGSILLTSATTCINTTGYMYGATEEAVITETPCNGASVYDVWYRFVAQTTSPSITLSAVGSAVSGAGMQVLSGTCALPVVVFCGTNSITTNSLLIGSVYYLRIYATAGSAPLSAANSEFSVCISDPVSAPPYNDECANAVRLPVGSACSNVTGTTAAATASAGIPAPCAGTSAYDVWYKFTAVNTTATVTLGGAANNFTNRSIQIFSGDCGTLTSMACGAATATVATTAGATYFVRVYSTVTPATAPNGHANFTICVTTTSPPPRFGNSYINLSKKQSGGVVQTGDTLEIRLSVNHTSGTLFGLRYVDNIPKNTAMLSGSTDSIRIITNEGLTFRHYTPAAGDDAATFLANPPAGEYNIRLNLGFAAFAGGTVVNNTETETASATGRMTNTNNPRGGGGMLFATSVRVVVTGAPGDTISLFPGKFIYQTTAGGPDVTLTAIPYKIIISNPLFLCADASGVNNAQEFGGTFGSGTNQLRGTDLSFPIPNYTYVDNFSAAQSIGDGRYAITKNISPRNSTNRAAKTVRDPAGGPAFEDRANRMHGGHWAIDGDHSGTNNAVGNTPPAAVDPGGYMLVVNADLVTTEAYRQTITGLCPNTYYEFSAWIRNICPTCGIDSVGNSYGSVAGGGIYKPGVYPNMSFALDGIDRYSTGEVDTLGWVKKGFVFVTGPAQTSLTFSIRNNSQGGGGNDWAMDDISIATCLPGMSYSPTLSPSTCRNNNVQINDTIRSYFNNYTNFKWQRSTDGGSTWSDISGATGDTAATFINGAWQYITSYTIPPSATNSSNNGDRYRVVVATTPSNLANADCQSTDGVSIINLVILNCDYDPLSTSLLSFTGRREGSLSKLSWTTSLETEPLEFDIERSVNGTTFFTVGSVKSHDNRNANTNNYSFTDTVSTSGKLFYRIAMRNKNSEKEYSRIVEFHGKESELSIGNARNPFTNLLSFDLTSNRETKLEASLVSLTGTTWHRESFAVKSGFNSFSLRHLDGLPPGMYLLKVGIDEKSFTKKVIKVN